MFALLVTIILPEAISDMAALFQDMLPWIRTSYRLLTAVCLIIAGWKIFTKAGESGWKIFIPYYNMYLPFKLTWKPGYFFVFLVSYMLHSFLMAQHVYAMTIFAWIFFGIACTIYACLYVHVARSFGKSTLYGICTWVICAPVFLMIIAFGNTEYQGNLSMGDRSAEEHFF